VGYNSVADNNGLSSCV